MSGVHYELTIAAQAKPFPWGPLAVALYINRCEAYKPEPIHIKALPVELLQPMTPGSTIELIRKNEFDLF